MSAEEIINDLAFEADVDLDAFVPAIEKLDRWQAPGIEGLETAPHDLDIVVAATRELASSEDAF